MNRQELSKASLEFKHEFLLEEYKLIITFMLGLVTGVTLSTIYTVPTWYYYTFASTIVAVLVWMNWAEPRRNELLSVQKEVVALARKS